MPLVSLNQCGERIQRGSFRARDTYMSSKFFHSTTCQFPNDVLINHLRVPTGVTHVRKNHENFDAINGQSPSSEFKTVDAFQNNQYSQIHKSIN